MLDIQTIISHISLNKVIFFFCHFFLLEFVNNLHFPLVKLFSLRLTIITTQINLNNCKNQEAFFVWCLHVHSVLMWVFFRVLRFYPTIQRHEGQKDRCIGDSNLLMGMSASVNMYNMSLCVTLCLEDGWKNAK